MTSARAAVVSAVAPGNPPEDAARRNAGTPAPSTSATVVAARVGGRAMTHKTAASSPPNSSKPEVRVGGLDGVLQPALGSGRRCGHDGPDDVGHAIGQEDDGAQAEQRDQQGSRGARAERRHDGLLRAAGTPGPVTSAAAAGAPNDEGEPATSRGRGGRARAASRCARTAAPRIPQHPPRARLRSRRPGRCRPGVSCARSCARNAASTSVSSSAKGVPQRRASGRRRPEAPSATTSAARHAATSAIAARARVARRAVRRARARSSWCGARARRAARASARAGRAPPIARARAASPASTSPAAAAAASDRPAARAAALGSSAARVQPRAKRLRSAGLVDRGQLGVHRATPFAAAAGQQPDDRRRGSALRGRGCRRSLRRPQRALARAPPRRGRGRRVDAARARGRRR